MQAEQVAGVRAEGRARPTPGAQVVEYRQVARQAIAMHGVEHQHVALPPQAAIEIQQASLGQGEQGLAGTDGSRIDIRHFGLGREIVGVADVLEPPQPQRRQGFRCVDGALRVVAVHRVDRQPRSVAENPQRPVDTAPVLVQPGRADLDLGVGVAEIDEAPQFLFQASQVVVRIGVAAAGVDRYALRIVFRQPQASRQEAMQRQAGGLGRGIPQRHVQGAHRDAAFAVAAGLLVAHHQVPGSQRIDATAVVARQAVRRSPQQARGETLADQPALGVAPYRGVAVADHTPTVAHGIGEHRHQAGAQTTGGSRHAGVTEKGNTAFPDLLDAHRLSAPPRWTSLHLSQGRRHGRPDRS